MQILAQPPLVSLFLPPLTSLNYLSHLRMIVSASDIKSELLGASLRFRIVVFLVQDFIEFLHQPDIDCKQKIWLFQLCIVQHSTVASWHGHIKVFEQRNDGLIISLDLLLEQSHHNLVHFLDGRVHLVLLQVLVRLKFVGGQLAWTILSQIVLRHAIKLITMPVRLLMDNLLLFKCRLLHNRLSDLPNRLLLLCRRVNHYSIELGGVLCDLLPLDDRSELLVTSAVHKTAWI
jgi:hypothetical protein